MFTVVPVVEEPLHLVILSQTLGWIYFLAWSMSFYGQVVENYKRKSVVGLNFDFLLYNVTGFIAYTIYTIKGYTNENLGTGPVSLSDVLFSTHALFITFFTIGQCFVYYDKDDPDQKISTICKVVTMCIWFGYFVLLLTEDYFNNQNPIFKGIGFPFNHVIYLGFSKVFINMIKYVPQAYSNYLRQSTDGWSIFNVVADFIGGFFSLAQNSVETYMGHSIVAVKGPSRRLNVSKFFLSGLTIFFDTIFIIQHYCLYNKRHQREKGRNENDHVDNENVESTNPLKKTPKKLDGYTNLNITSSNLHIDAICIEERENRHECKHCSECQKTEKIEVNKGTNYSSIHTN